MTIIYHGEDHDGHCSGAIAKMYCDEHNIPSVMIPVNYGQPIPDVKGQDVVMLDFCFQPHEKMTEAILSAKSFTWIDHHISAIKTFGNSNLEGIRDTQFSACELAWKYFFPYDKMPKVVELLGKYDSWRHDNDPYILGFEYFMQSLDTDPRTFDWKSYFAMPNKDVYDKSAIGTAIIRRSELLNAKDMREAFPKDINGLHCLCLNTSSKGSSVFGNRLHEFDACIVFKRTAEGNYSCSIYASSNNDVDVSVFASNFGGGGHKKASGFRLTKEQYDKYIG